LSPEQEFPLLPLSLSLSLSLSLHKMHSFQRATSVVGVSKLEDFLD
jgi:hypothetical protein